MTEIVPSDEQKAIIDSFLTDNSGPNIKLTSVAGSGKSTTILLCAKNVPDKQCIILTYNKKLQMDVKHKIEKMKLKNTKIMTYHSAACRGFDEKVYDDVHFINALKECGEKPLPGMDKLICDVLFLDEVQDMTIPYYLFVSKMVADLPKLQVMVVGDVKQSINQFKDSREEFLSQCEVLPGFNSKCGRPWVEHRLSISYRLTPHMASFVNNHVLCTPGAIRAGNTTMPHAALKVHYVALDFRKMAREIGKVIKEVIKKYGHENVAIIAPSIKSIRSADSKNPLSITVREYLTDVPIYIPRDDEVLNEDSITGKLIICSWNSMKGAERDCIIVMNFDETYFQYYHQDWVSSVKQLLPNIMYVAATRAKKELIIVADPKKTLRSINLSQLMKDCTVIVNGKISTPSITSKKRKSTIASTISVSDLVKHLSAVTMHMLIKMLKVSKSADDSCKSAGDSCRDKHPSGSDVDFVINFAKDDIKYTESVSFLYSLVIHAIVELKKTGTSTFGESVREPVIVSNVDDYVPFEYCITESAYKKFPPHFWENVKDAFDTRPEDRKKDEWFQLAIAENVFLQNGHHLARQIIDYKWVDDKFVDEMSECILKTLENAEGKFKQILSTTIDEYDIRGMPSFVQDDGVIWDFKCTDDINNEHLLHLACCMAINNVRRGKLYLLLSGKIINVELKNGDEFLRLVLTKYNEKDIGDLLTDIEKFKGQYLGDAKKEQISKLKPNKFISILKKFV